MIRRSVIAVAVVIALSAAAASTQAFADVSDEAAVTQAVAGTAPPLHP